MAETTNGQNGQGKARPLSELLAEVEREKASEAREHQVTVEELLTALVEKVNTLAAPPPLLRSSMSAREKSDYINTHGQSKYWELPWDDAPPKRDRFGRFV